jgi:glycine cleavage system protein P-like pyridoxal-binding family
MAGFDSWSSRPHPPLCVDLEALKAAVSERTAAFMITNPTP